MSDESSGLDPFAELAHEFVERLRRGERPSLTEYADRHPELADQIRELFPALVEMEQFGSGGGAETGPFSVGDDGAGVVPRVLGDYRVVREIGRGGMGIVYEAVQESLGRHVALKVLPNRRILAANQLERFIREAKAAALLHHTNIVPVFGVGDHEGVHFYAMQYIEGQGLDAVLAEVKRLRLGRPGALASVVPQHAALLATSVAQGLLAGRFQEPGLTLDQGATVSLAGVATGGPGEPPPPVMTAAEAEGRADSTSSIMGRTESHYHLSVARLAAQVAEALAHAHAHGVLHRDIKPANLLVDLEGTAWVTDFGLAKSAGSDELTSPGDIVGTLRYMAPERFRGQSDPRSDVYGLGLTLYEMLTTEPAFAASERAMLIDRVLHEEPRRPRAIDPRIPRDLETVILKAIAKEPGARYQSAGDMAEDLRRYLADQPIRARRISVAERTWRWARRNPVVATMGGSLAAVFLVGLPLVTALWLNSNRLYRLSELRRVDAEASFAQARGAVDDYLTTVSEDTLLRSPVPGLQPLRRRLLEAALRYHRDFARRHADDPSVRADLAFAHHYLARFFVSGSGRFKKDENHLRRAIELRGALANDRPDDPAYGTELSLSLSNLGELQYRAGRTTEALATTLRANTTQQDLVRRWRDDSQLRHLLSLSTRGLAVLNRTLGRRKESEDLYRASAAIIAKVVAENPAVIEYRRVLATSNEELGQERVDQGDLTEGLEWFDRAREQAEIVQGSIPEDTNNLVTLASIHRGIGKALGKQGKPAEGLASLDRAVAIGERVERRDSLAAYDLACTLALCSELAASLPQGTERGNPEAARRDADRSVVQLRKSIAAGWKDVDWMERDPELAALRARPDYREVIADLRQARAPASK